MFFWGAAGDFEKLLRPLFCRTSGNGCFESTSNNIANYRTFFSGIWIKSSNSGMYQKRKYNLFQTFIISFINKMTIQILLHN